MLASRSLLTVDVAFLLCCICQSGCFSLLVARILHESGHHLTTIISASLSRQGADAQTPTS